MMDLNRQELCALQQALSLRLQIQRNSVTTWKDDEQLKPIKETMTLLKKVQKEIWANSPRLCKRHAKKPIRKIRSGRA